MECWSLKCDAKFVFSRFAAVKDMSGNQCVSRMKVFIEGETDAYNCPRNYSIPYSDDYARNRLWPLIGATKTQPKSELVITSLFEEQKYQTRKSLYRI